MWRWGTRLIRRRFFFIATVCVLSLAILVFAVMLFLFRRDPVNSLVVMLAEETLNVEATKFAFDQSRTEVSFPRLNGTGSVHLYNITLDSPTGEYRLLHIPHVRLDYDLFGIPNRPLDRVVIDQGLYAVANFTKEDGWIDSALIKPQPENTEPSSFQLPEVLLSNAFIRFRAPMVLRDPTADVAGRTHLGNAFTYKGNGGHYLSNISASLLQDPSNPNVSNLRLSSACDQWGTTKVSGRIDLAGDISFRAVKRGLLLDQQLVDRLKEEIAPQVDRVYADDGKTKNRIDLSADIELPRNGRPRIMAHAEYQGSLMYRDFPLLLEDAAGLIEFELTEQGADIRIVDASARRGSAKVRVTGGVFDVATENEKLEFDIALDGLVLSPELLRKMVGEQTQDGDPVFSEWENYKRPGAGSKPNERPNSSPIVSKIRSMLEPSGLVSARVNYFQESKDKGRMSTSFRIIIADSSAQYTGDPSVVTAMVKANTTSPEAFDLASMRSLRRLEGDIPSPMPTVSEPFAGFPLPLYDLSGVVTGEISTVRAPEFRVLGLNTEDERLIEETLGLKVLANRKGLTANRADTGQKISLDLTYRGNQGGSARDDSRLTARFSTEGFKVDDEVVSLLPLAIRSQIEQFGLRGAVDIERGEIVVDAIETPESPGAKGPPPRVQLTLAAKSLGGRYTLPGASEPIVFDRIKGTVSFNLDRESLTVRDLEGSALDSILRASQISVTSQRLSPVISVSADFGQLAITSSLFRKLPSQMAMLERMFGANPTGTLSGTVALDFGPNRRDITLSATLRGATVTHESISPFTLHQADGEFTIEIREEGIEVRIHRMTGVPGIPIVTRTGLAPATVGIGPDILDGRPASRITVSGGVFLPGPYAPDQRTALDLHVSGERVLLSSEIRTALDAMAGGTPERPGTIATLWTSLEPFDAEGVRKPIGRIDIDGSLSLRVPLVQGVGKLDVDYLMNVSMSNGQIRYETFPLPLTGVEMRATLAPDVIHFSKLTAVTEGAKIRVPRLSMSSGNLLMDIDVNEFPIGSPALRAALPLGMRGGIDAVNPTGLADASIALRVSPDRMEFESEVELRAASMAFGITFTNCKGSLSLRGEFARDASLGVVPLLTKGDLHLEEAFWKKVKLENITSSLQFHEQRMVLPNIRGRAHGGVFQGNLALMMGGTEGTKYQGAISAQGLLLESLATAISGGESSEGNERMIGGLDAELTFFSPDKSGLMGRGRIDIGRVPLTPDELARLDTLTDEERKGKPAELGAVPLFGGLYRELKVGSGEYFDEAAMVFHLQSDHIEIRQMNLISNAIRIETTGQNRIFYDKPKRGDQIDLKFVPTLFPRTATLPVAQTVFDAFKGVVLGIYVGGTMDAPEVRPFSNTRKVEDDARDLPEPSRTKLDG